MGHIPKDFESHECFYCDNKLEDDRWESVWVGQKHYKVNKCKCGKRVWIKVEFSGSGHDDFKHENELESMVRKVEGGKGDA
ncbi:hypothetical protein COV20_04460 [Candidatus Woesearchaeota archaeon CG10_big_fil_rev_8_21_14_0_10_45_16]|nr:MAG: hypothetical protein COV20_04460 [Candidatus Woesearchaeota archaeon CG10_big_fil_rev_8_21_14_0_10_45_16]